jgi:hypothetical protein
MSILIRRFAACLVVSACALWASPVRAAEGAAKAANVTEWNRKNFVHPPLKCMEIYKRIDAYPVAAWCFHGTQGIRSKPLPFDEAYARNAKSFGFNVLIDAGSMIEPCAKVGGIKVVVPAFWQKPDKLMQGIFGPHGDSPALMGVVLDDNCPGIAAQVAANGKWVTDNYPHVMPWISENPNSKAQSKTVVRVMGTQNYAFLRGTRNPVNGYCDGCTWDREVGNRSNMTAWEIYGGNVSFPKQRFQILAALAYGAQGVVNFAYVPNRVAVWKPGSALAPKMHKVQTYVADVVGRHLWGTRCFEVIHSIHGGGHRKAINPRSDRLVAKTSNFVLVGMLSPEAKFYAAKDDPNAVPEYFMIVDKRALDGNDLDDLYVMLSPKVPVLEMLDEQALATAKVRKLVPGYKFRRRTEPGEGVLLRVSPDLDKLLGGKAGLELYAAINQQLASLQWKIDPPDTPEVAAAKPAGEATAKPGQPAPGSAAPRITAAQGAGVLANVKGKIGELQQILAAAVRAGTISKEQAADTIQRLNEAVDATAKDLQPQPSAPETPPQPADKRK